jgi:putative redox protein
MDNTDEWRVVVTNGEGRLAQTVRVSAHALTADEPKPLGDDTGPAPHDFLLAALGTCTAMTLKLYTARKGWDVGALTIRLNIRWEKIEGAADKRAVIERVVESDRALTAEQQTRLHEIAEKCPVHKTLMGEKRIETRLSAPPPGA